eukprot:TRINITY_DN32474_c0_g2_i2.p1 TRINITY_DN32474_c0_g2~~TRINITY_DN32474_c0_g2_i2.p1  ORF type:complete len:314 (+),score=41.73 TRINITY_DN32474_c0_g2_i2:280-1221(+)
MGEFKYLVIAGISDVADSATGFASQPHVAPLVYALMNQTTTPFTALVSLVLLGTRYTLWETVAVLTVIGAAVMCVLVGSYQHESDSVFWATFAAVTTIFAAFSFVLKEKAFSEYTLHASGLQQHNLLTSKMADDHPENQMWDLDQPVAAVRERMPPELSVFLVGTVVGTVSLLTCVPIALLNQSIVGTGPVWSTFEGGMRCLFECEHAMSAYAVYIGFNVFFNLSLLFLTSYSSALLAFLSLKMTVPLVAVLSPVHWPLYTPQSVTAGQWGALVLMAVGVVAFRVSHMQRERLVREQKSLEPAHASRICCWPL